MEKSWTGYREHQRLSKRLIAAEGRGLLDCLVPLLRMAFHEEIGEVGPVFDSRLGDDHLVWSMGSDRLLVVLCQRVGVAGIGLEEIRRCREGIKTFASAGLRSSAYLLVHNYDRQEQDFREEMQSELDALKAAGLVERSELWNRQRVLAAAFNGMLRYTLKVLRVQDLSPTPVTAIDQPFVPLAEVPYQVSSLVIDRHHWKGAKLVVPPVVSDPVQAILNKAEGSLSLLVGEFGLGKTTVVGRALKDKASRLLFVPGARIASKNIAGTKDFLMHCINEDRLLESFPEEERSTLGLLARASILHVLRWDTDLQVSLVIDGVDESAVVGRRGGFQYLFNILQEVRIPVVLTMRTELWEDGKEDFTSIFGKTPSDVSSTRNRRVRLVELLPWQRDQIKTLIQRYRESCPDPEARLRLERLEFLLEGEEFEHYYGDIPSRPLFLRFILDTVAQHGLPVLRVGRARLVHDWVSQKLYRDANAPIEAGGEGRISIPLDVAWEAMMRAAAAMVTEEDGQVGLLEDYRLDHILDSNPRLAEQIKEARELFLGSLLLQSGSHRLGLPRRVRFAHRTFQEYFLAWCSLVEPDLIPMGELPEDVRDWASRIQEEGLVPQPSSRRAQHSPVRQAPAFSTGDQAGGELKADLEIRVETYFENGRTRLFYTFRSKSGDAPFYLRRIEGPVLEGSAAEYHARLMERLEEMGRGRDGDGAGLLRREIDNKLVGFGRRLFRDLFHSTETRKAYRRFRGLSSLTVTSDEPWIPWELVKAFDDSDPADPIDDPFFCQKFLMTRWLVGADEPPCRIYVRRLACFSFSAKPLPFLAEEHRFVQSLAGPQTGVVDASPVAKTAAAFEQLLQRGGTDLLHFVGHGNFDSRFPNEAPLHFSDRPFRPEDLHGPLTSRVRQDRPFVFLNACRTAQQGLGLTGLGGWANAWVKDCGCGVFIGPLWSMSDQLGFEFAKAIYAALKRGDTLGKATQEAREVVRTLRPGHPAWLAYSVYGHVNCQLVLGENGEAETTQAEGPKRES